MWWKSESSDNSARQYAGRIIDIHCHILPGLDDGSPDMKETLKMLKIAHEQGITDIVTTPHFKAGRHNASVKTVRERLDAVRETAENVNIPIRLYQGNEILYYGGMEEDLESGRILTLNGTQYALVEFMPEDEYTYIRNGLDSVMGMGYSPILAHIERYACMLKKEEYAKQIHDMGVEIQINASSFMGKNGRKPKEFVKKILERHLVDYVATDSHNSVSRTPHISECADLISKKYGADYAEEIFYMNAWDRLLKGNGDVGKQ